MGNSSPQNKQEIIKVNSESLIHLYDCEIGKKTYEYKFQLPGCLNFLSPDIFFETYSNKDDLVCHDRQIKNQFVAMVHTAFQYHFPLILTPDSVWFTIAQGLSLCINQNPEKVRSVFVSHKGKERLLIVLPDTFSPGDPNNNWSSVINVFSEMIKKHIGSSIHDIIVSNFSTTTSVEKIVSEIVLMESMKAYFKYDVMSDCGIPKIKLEGTVEDWEKILEKVQKLNKLLPPYRWWFSKLFPLLKEFIELKKGNLDKTYWNSFYKWNVSSGCDSVSGHINALFPILQDFSNQYKRSYYFDQGYDTTFPSTSTFCCSLSKAPFTWVDLNLDMEFVGGIVGFEQDHETMALKSKFGWGVGTVKKSNNNNISSDIL